MTGLTNPLHLAILFLIVLLVFGAKRLPEIGRSLGSGMREFKDSVSGNHDAPAQSQQQYPPQQQYQQLPQSPPQQQYEQTQQQYQPPQQQHEPQQQPTAEPPVGTQDTTAPAPPRENQPTS